MACTDRAGSLSSSSLNGGTDALASFRRLGDRWGVAATSSIRGWEHLRRGALPDARRDGAESWSLFVEVGDQLEFRQLLE